MAARAAVAESAVRRMPCVACAQGRSTGAPGRMGQAGFFPVQRERLPAMFQDIARMIPRSAAQEGIGEACLPGCLKGRAGFGA